LFSICKDRSRYNGLVVARSNAGSNAVRVSRANERSRLTRYKVLDRLLIIHLHRARSHAWERPRIARQAAAALSPLSRHRSNATSFSGHCDHGSRPGTTATAHRALPHPAGSRDCTRGYATVDLKWLASSPSLLGGDRASFDKLARWRRVCARARAREHVHARGVDHGRCDERRRRREGLLRGCG